jgi:hypothetical protein
MMEKVIVPPDPGSVKFWLQARKPEVYREKKQHEHAIGIEDGLRACMEEMVERSRLRRAERAKLIDRTNATEAEGSDAWDSPCAPREKRSPS